MGMGFENNKYKWINRLICRIFGHDLYDVKTFSPDGTQIRCRMCGQRFDSNSKIIESNKKL